MWQAKKLADIALSSAEAEYMALFYACQAGVWLRRLLKELDIEVWRRNGDAAICGGSTEEPWLRKAGKMRGGNEEEGRSSQLLEM
ncbi:hypothetical protein CLOP_g18731 [Closterium sp. NIES-67]|nr:hypothetical protein CLOP_g18731 [Closterium sp. NIES-67]